MPAGAMRGKLHAETKNMARLAVRRLGRRPALLPFGLIVFFAFVHMKLNAVIMPCDFIALSKSACPTVTGRCVAARSMQGVHLRAQEDALSASEAAAETLPRWKRVLQGVRKNGVGYFCALNFISGMNGFILFGISWGLFVRATGGSPVMFDPNIPVPANVALLLFRPKRINPKYLLYHGAVYVSLSWISRPLRFSLAVPLTRYSQRFFDVIQKRLACPRFLTWVLALFVPFVVGMPVLVATAYLTCAILRVPVTGY